MMFSAIIAAVTAMTGWVSSLACKFGNESVSWLVYAVLTIDVEGEVGTEGGEESPDWGISEKVGSGVVGARLLLVNAPPPLIRTKPDLRLWRNAPSSKVPSVPVGVR
jgi:hypothetical protein